MKIPLSWIKRFIRLDRSAEEIADLLTLAGIEVEKIDRYKFSFEGVIVGLIKEIHPHENADKLRVLKVSDGKKDHTVVCGAPVLHLNKKVPFAVIGSILDKDSNDPFKISKAKIRGIESKGMLCTAKELGTGPDGNSILFLDDSAPLGMDFVEYYRDPVFDITLTPNLGHCRSVLGVARELARHFDSELSGPEIKIEKSTGKSANDLLSVSNELKDSCYQFAARVVTGVEVKDSPAWLKDLLEKSGISSINNVVDITNFVLHELGQPLHAYDYSTLDRKELTIRESRKGETIKTLDGKERSLDEGHIVISSSDVAIGIAGIMGGESTAVSKNTHTVVLEAAEFCSSRIRKSSRELKLRSEASSRFENQIDSGGLLHALDYAAFLLQELAGGSIAAEVIHEAVQKFRPSFLTARLSRINKILGTKLSLNEVETFLVSLGFAATTDGEDLFQLKIPSWRNDIKEEIDIIEEVARVYGYNNISTEHPKHISSLIPHHPLYSLEKILRTKLIGLGLQEFLTCSLISKDLCGLKVGHEMFEVSAIEVLHAKSVDQSLLRPSLLPGLLASMVHNKNNGTTNIAVFEIGKIFSKGKDGYLENSSLGMLLTGNASPHYHDSEDKLFDFFHLKGILENLFSGIGIASTKIKRSSHETFHPGVQANILVDGDVVATFGKVHPAVTSKMKLEEETFFAEVDMYLIEKYRVKNPVFKAIPTLPSSSRDVTFTMQRETELSEVFKLLENAPMTQLKEYRLQNIYIDEKNEEDTKNVTFRFIYRDDHNTLDDSEITTCHEKVISYLSKAL